MRFGIKLKFVSILLIATVLPLAIGIGAIWALGHHYYLRERGKLFQAAANHLALNLNDIVLAQADQLADWNTLARLAEQIPVPEPPGNMEAFYRQMQARDEHWNAAPATAPEIQAALTNDLARQLDAFRDLNTLFAEILLTDNTGQLLAATSKTSDYFQADEPWWQHAVNLPDGQVFLDGISYDESAGVYSIDIAVPVRAPGTNAPLRGVIKGVLSITPLFASLPPIPRTEAPSRQLVLADGRVMGDGEQLDHAEHSQQIAAPATQSSGPTGWYLAKLTDTNDRLVGFATVKFQSTLPGNVLATGMAPFQILVHEDKHVVLAPVLRMLAQITLAGIGVIALFALIGYYVASRHLLRPIHTLQTAAQAIAVSARDDAPPQTTNRLARRAVRGLQSIRSGDEFEMLARDFVTMAARVLRYHEQLREELALKTAEIQRDLDVAREFQEALMPHTYPEVGSAGVPDRLMLHFHHAYRPTSSVGGDFFDLLKLSEHRAGIFIADVMGHGARSALVTAILRTLLQDLARYANDPARFLGQINSHFHEIIQQSSQLLFVSAFYIVIDTEQGTATFASAGHPSPLVAMRDQKRIEPLLSGPHNEPALGLFPDTKYVNYTRPLQARDVFVLFTDGVVEARNAKGEEFSRDRLAVAVRNCLTGGGDLHALTQAVLAAVDRFRDDVPLADDLCLVTCEVADSTRPALSPP